MTIPFELQMLVVFLLDLIIGDPRWIPHPVNLIARIARFFEDFFRKRFKYQSLAGFFTAHATIVTVLFFSVSFFVFLCLVNTAVADAIAILFLASLIACKDLMTHSRRVYNGLIDNEELEPARKAIAMIVGRDTSKLDQAGICRACVETVAENMVDGVTAPIFYAVIFSMIPGAGCLDPICMAAIGALFYKSINTMDSLFGYKNDRYIFFGRTAAVIDDLVNFIPARISGFLLIPTAALVPETDWRQAMKIFFRDRLQHGSPNGGHPESATAGALGIQLGGSSYYFGSIVDKPTMGDPGRTIIPQDILKTNQMMLVGSLLFLFLMLTARSLLI